MIPWSPHACTQGLQYYSIMPLHYITPAPDSAGKNKIVNVTNAFRFFIMSFL